MDRTSRTCSSAR